MGWNIPKQVASLLVGDDTTSRALGNVTRALQPVLDFCNSTFSLAQNGALQIARNIVLQSLNVNGQVVVNGAQVIYGFKGVNNTLVVVPGGTGAAFYVTNQANSVANFLVNADGTVFGNNTWSTSSVVSGQGFKSWVHMGSYWNTNTTSGNNFNTVTVIFNANTGGLSYINRQWVANRSGSLTGISVTLNNSIAVSMTWALLKNGTTCATTVVGANGLKSWATFPKGTTGGSFVAGDVFTCQVVVAAGYNFAGAIDMEIEEGA